MHHLYNLNMVIESDVVKLDKSLVEDDWNRIVKLMRAFSDRKNIVIEGSTYVKSPDQACKLKRIAIFTILESLVSLIKEKEKQAFHCLYWTLKIFG